MKKYVLRLDLILNSILLLAWLQNPNGMACEQYSVTRPNFWQTFIHNAMPESEVNLYKIQYNRIILYAVKNTQISGTP